MKQQIQGFLSKNYNSRNIVSGEIITIEADGVWVNVGLEELVNIPQKFISDLKCDRLNEGEIIEFLVSRSISQDDKYQFYLNFELLERLRIEQRINQLKESINY